MVHKFRLWRSTNRINPNVWWYMHDSWPWLSTRGGLTDHLLAHLRRQRRSMLAVRSCSFEVVQRSSEVWLEKDAVAVHGADVDLRVRESLLRSLCVACVLCVMRVV